MFEEEQILSQSSQHSSRNTYTHILHLQQTSSISSSHKHLFNSASHTLFINQTLNKSLSSKTHISKKPHSVYLSRLPEAQSKKRTPIKGKSFYKQTPQKQKNFSSSQSYATPPLDSLYFHSSISFDKISHLCKKLLKERKGKTHESMKLKKNVQGKPFNKSTFNPFKYRIMKPQSKVKENELNSLQVGNIIDRSEVKKYHGRRKLRTREKKEKFDRSKENPILWIECLDLEQQERKLSKN